LREARVSTFALVSGSLFRKAERKTSKAGKAYVTATVRAVAGNESEFWRLIVFSETAQAELMRLADGDKLSAQGSMKIELYRANDGSEKISRTLLADGVLTLKPQPRERKPKPAERAQQAPDPNGRRDFDDSIPF
jgi:single-stranded DNA-binding protein